VVLVFRVSFAAWAECNGWVFDVGLTEESGAERLFVVDELDMCGMMRERERFQVAAKSRDIDRAPCGVGPFILCLNVVAKVPTVNLESEVGFDVARVPDVVDGD
jgi:hypothetical protein